MPTKFISAPDAYTFVQLFQQAVKDGYYIDNSSDNGLREAFIKSMLLMREPFNPVHKKPSGVVFTKIEHMSSHQFMMMIQQAVIEGYEVDMSSLLWSVTKYCKFIKSDVQKAEAPQVDLKEEQVEVALAVEPLAKVGRKSKKTP